MGAIGIEPPEPPIDMSCGSRFLRRVYDVDGHACPACSGRLRPAGAVLPPHAKTWIEAKRIVPLVATGPPDVPVQLSLPIAS